ncbi:MAG: uracil-DNA glycosylase, partial [Burkholderiaceae bacterium]|nr:uracil-DNA glycosylase [Burkholderiaceae bacterium]
MAVQDASGWAELTAEFWSSPKGSALKTFLDGRRADGATIYPPEPLRALQLTPPDEVRVVVLGQD